MIAAESTPVAQLHQVRKHYRQGGGEVMVLRGLDLSLNAGEAVAVMGPSGSGKSTLLNMLTGLDTPDEGRVQVCGQRVDGMGSAARARLRSRHLGIVFQQASLLPELTAQRNVALPLQLWPCSSADARRRAALALALVGMDGQGERLPHQLSGGQQQRVAVARALVTDPDLLICDEPTASLDAETAREVLTLLRTLCTRLRKAVLLVTHDRSATAFVDRVLELRDGVLTDVTGGAHG